MYCNSNSFGFLTIRYPDETQAVTGEGEDDGMPPLETTPPGIKVKSAKLPGWRKTTEAERAEARAQWQWSKGKPETATKVCSMVAIISS